MNKKTRKLVLGRIRKLISARYGTNVTLAAEKIGVSYWTLWRTLRGERELSLHLLDKISKHFDVSFDVLVSSHD